MAIQKIDCPSDSCFDGKLATLKPREPMECPDCEGKGWIEADPIWQVEGELIKNNRLNVYGMGIRRFCKQHGIDDEKYSQVERGIIEAPDWLKDMFNVEKKLKNRLDHGY